MASQHADPPLTVRPPADALASAQAVLTEHDLAMRGFISACLNALAADPEGFLHSLDGHWPPEKPRGRPKTSSTPAAD
jgi:hypothetical protein